MFLRRFGLQTAGCSNCRRTVVNTFISTVGHEYAGTSSHVVSLPIRSLRTPAVRSPQSIRGFASKTTTPTSDDKPLVENHQGTDEEQLTINDGPNVPPPAETDVPWYLQPEVFPQAQESTRPRLEIPELPADAPPLLQPTLEFLVYQLGLDDLKLVDLRELDPPPALGSNVLMVLGTARSERHLHTSGERLRRWFKMEQHKLAHADGLIGRGELKLRLKRRARRARMLSKVGSVDTAKPDDPLRSGWVCVTVEDTEATHDEGQEEEIEEDSGNIIGFGDFDVGPKLVVQMLTGEKREELDLEGLWGDILWRHSRKEAKILRAEAALASEQDHDREGDNTTSAGTGQVVPTMPRASNKIASPKIQVRGFSSLGRLRDIQYVPPQTITEDDGSSSQEGQLKDMSSRVQESESTKLDTSAAQASQQIESHTQLGDLDAHIAYLLNLEPDEARLALDEDKETPSFLQSFSQNLALFPYQHQWESLLALHCIGIQYQCQRYTKKSLLALISEMRCSLISIPSSFYALALKTLLAVDEASSRLDGALTTTRSLSAAAELLEDMCLRGDDIAAVEELHGLFEQAVLSTRAKGSTETSQLTQLLKTRNHLNGIFAYKPSSESEIRRLHLYADHDDWDGVWDIWRGFAVRLETRPKEIYVALLERLSERAHDSKILDGMRNVLVERDVENAVVPFDADIAEAVLLCLRAVYPDIDERGSGDWSSNEAKIKLWRKCVLTIQDSRPFLRDFDDD